MPGSVARTDLISPDQTEPLARALYHALREHVLTLPDDLPVYPTHGAGSFCAAASDGERITTIGREKATNPLLAAPDEDSFVRLVLASFGTYPPYFERLRDVNRRGPRIYGAFPPLTGLPLSDVDREVAAGAEVIDVRPIEQYAAAHIAGSLSIALRPAFASWLGWLARPEAGLLFVLAPDQDRRDLVRQALGIGYERLVGELAGGIEAWREAGRPLVTTPLTRSAGHDGSRVVDVRQASEFRGGHVPGARLFELGSLVGPGAVRFPDGAVVMCGHGERAMSAASLAERAGLDVTVFEGSPADWTRLAGQRLTNET